MESESKSTKSIKLPYFHRTLSAEDQALIGDITPKPLIVKNTDNTDTTKLTQSSAWNAAKTWEERDCTVWAKDNLTSIFNEKQEINTTSPFKITLESISNIEGTAQIAHVRGTARFIYELSFSLSLTIEDETHKKFIASAIIHDVINDQLDDIEVSVTVSKPTPSGAALIEMKNVLIKQKNLKIFIISKMKIFEEKYRKL
jgi:hypothetical protein